MNDFETFVVSVENPTQQDLEALSNVMAFAQSEMTKYVTQLAVELNVPEACAMDIYYLRNRSRWTPELEAELIRLHKEGNVPNMNEFGN